MSIVPAPTAYAPRRQHMKGRWLGRHHAGSVSGRASRARSSCVSRVVAGTVGAEQMGQLTVDRECNMVADAKAALAVSFGDDRLPVRQARVHERSIAEPLDQLHRRMRSGGAANAHRFRAQPNPQVRA